MAEPMSDQELAEVRADLAARSPENYDGLSSVLLAEVDRLRAALARVTGDDMVRRLAQAEHSAVCRARDVDACLVGPGAWVYDAEKVVELIDEVAQDEIDPGADEAERVPSCLSCSESAEDSGEGRYCGSCEDYEGTCVNDHCLTCGRTT